MSAFAGQRVAVWGAGASGVAAANLLVKLGASVVLSDNAPEKSLQINGLLPEVEVVGGGNVLGGARVLVPSPGIKPSTPALVAARASARLVSEIELAASVVRGPIVAISGTDGKSTTTEMCGAVARAAGCQVEVCGNIGTPFSEVASDDPATVWVVEVSAFQLWSCGAFRPRIAIVTNVAGDHADYFDGDTRAYAQAKARVLTEQGPGDTAILRAEDPVVSAFSTGAGVARVLFGPSPRARGLGLDGGFITLDGQPVMGAGDLPLLGNHNIANAQAALAAGLGLGLSLAPMVESLKHFQGLPHRLEHIGDLLAGAVVRRLQGHQPPRQRRGPGRPAGAPGGHHRRLREGPRPRAVPAGGAAQGAPCDRHRPHRRAHRRGPGRPAAGRSGQRHGRRRRARRPGRPARGSGGFVTGRVVV
jgi:UDP-N-acetylmuramoylalanine--D-glutamate ligase